MYFTVLKDEYALYNDSTFRNYHIYTQLFAKSLSIEAYGCYTNVNLNL